VAVGVLALQGDVQAHARALEAVGLEPIAVRRPDQLSGLAGLVLPGGESTTMLRLMDGSGMERALRGAAAAVPVLATCAGLILLAREVHGPPQPSLGVLDVAVTRNGYGRQLQSAVVPLAVVAEDELAATALEGVFIRAPRISDAGPGVRVLATRDGEPVLVRAGGVLGATFHPELSTASPVIGLFARMVRGGA
jgi:pyridoxal 5'-phosphate synthase pdxT subunit